MSDKTFEKLKAALLDLLSRGDALPDADMLAQHSGLKPRVVRQFLGGLTSGRVFRVMQLLTPDVLRALYQNAVDNNYQAQKLWLQLAQQLEEQAPAYDQPRVVVVKMPLLEKPENSANAENTDAHG